MSVCAGLPRASICLDLLSALCIPTAFLLHLRLSPLGPAPSPAINRLSPSVSTAPTPFHYKVCSPSLSLPLYTPSLPFAFQRAHPRLFLFPPLALSLPHRFLGAPHSCLAFFRPIYALMLTSCFPFAPSQLLFSSQNSIFRTAIVAL